MSSAMRVVFMGTPEFAVASLDSIIKHDYNVVGVITSPDKASGRGQKIHESAVKLYAKEKELNILQPPNLKDPGFHDELAALGADVQVVVAFRMLPEVIWRMPPKGTVNLHASLLPDYRGAAPINWAVINGDTETGLTTFFIEKEIDTGKVILQEKVQIPDDWSAGQLHDDMMRKGGALLVRTLEVIETGSFESIDQKKLLANIPDPRSAPKIYKDNCKIDWKGSSQNICNHVRGLNPYPTAWSELVSSAGEVHSVKVFRCSRSSTPHNLPYGAINSVDNIRLSVACGEGVVNIEELQLAGKKRMLAADFLRGFNLNDDWKFH
jgi:methionyl-tRNA formyltransferase